jgi:hypothetical protein
MAHTAMTIPTEPARTRSAKDFRATDRAACILASLLRTRPVERRSAMNSLSSTHKPAACKFWTGMQPRVESPRRTNLSREESAAVRREVPACALRC